MKKNMDVKGGGNIESFSKICNLQSGTISRVCKFRSNIPWKTISKTTNEPRRMNLPPDVADDWKKIGSKRYKFDDLGLPLPVDKFPRHKTIYIKE